MFLLIYVDGIIIIASDQSAITKLLQLLNVEFAVKNLGDLHYFLGVEVLKLESGLLLSQRRYISGLVLLGFFWVFFFFFCAGFGCSCIPPVYLGAPYVF
jgi:hypothetical protein